MIESSTILLTLWRVRSFARFQKIDRNRIIQESHTKKNGDNNYDNYNLDFKARR